MKGLLPTIGICMLLATAAADARGWRSDNMVLAQAQGPHSKKGGPGPGQGQFQRGDPGRQQQGQGGQNQREQGRLTQEERQGLHRDLDRANREIYRRR